MIEFAHPAAYQLWMGRWSTRLAPGGPFTLKAHAWAVRGRVPGGGISTDAT